MIGKRVGFTLADGMGEIFTGEIVGSEGSKWTVKTDKGSNLFTISELQIVKVLEPVNPLIDAKCRSHNCPEDADVVVKHNEKKIRATYCRTHSVYYIQQPEIFSVVYVKEGLKQCETCGRIAGKNARAAHTDFRTGKPCVR